MYSAEPHCGGQGWREGSDREERSLVTGRGDGKEQSVMGLEQKEGAAEQEAVRKASQRARLMPPTHLEKLGQLNIGKLSPIIPVIHVTSSRSPYLFWSFSSKPWPRSSRNRSLPQLSVSSHLTSRCFNVSEAQLWGRSVEIDSMQQGFLTSEVLPSFPASLEQTRTRI